MQIKISINGSVAPSFLKDVTVISMMSGYHYSA
jgi:hypothetical protein